MIEPRKLTIVPNSLFNSEIKPIFDDAEAIKLGLDPLEEEALIKTHKTREQLALAPDLPQVWNAFVEYINRYQTKKGNTWNSPIKAGFNIINFDNPIIDRMCEKYGPWDKTWATQNLFHPLHNIDLMQEFWKVTENIRINNTNSISLDNIRDWLEMDKNGSHDAKNDVLDCAELVIRFLKLHRKLYTGIPCIHCRTPNKIKFQGSLAGWKRPVI